MWPYLVQREQNGRACEEHQIDQRSVSILSQGMVGSWLALRRKALS